MTFYKCPTYCDERVHYDGYCRQMVEFGMQIGISELLIINIYCVKMIQLQVLVVSVEPSCHIQVMTENDVMRIY